MLFFAGLVVGGIFGFSIGALCAAASNYEDVKPDM